MASNGNEKNETMTMLTKGGFLYKQGAKGFVKGWKRRWFSLKNNTQIHYYKSAEETHSLGFIDANTISGVRETPNSAIRRDKGEFLFEVYTPNRVYHLMANNEKFMKYWIDGISQLVQSLKTPSSPALPSPPKEVPTASAAATKAAPTSEKSAQPIVKKATISFSQVNDKISVTVISVSEPVVNYARGTGLYCLAAIENQQVKTKISKDGRWNETFSWDVSDLQNHLVIMVWGQEDNTGKFYGQISLSLGALKDKYLTAKEDPFPLVGNQDLQQNGGSILLVVHYSTAEKNVGVDDFELLKVLGKGNFGKVMQVRKKDTGRIYAMKVLKKSAIIAADAVQHTLSETSVLRRIKHPFIVSLKYAFQTEDKLYMILDYLNGGELFFHLSNVDRFSDERSKFYAAEIVLALGYLHANSVVYRDLKPENLLLNMDGHVCLTDFGLVKENLGYGDVTHTFCGSPEYLAPEILQGKGYGRAVDWWALGTLIYEMLEGLPPFYDEEVSEMNRRILRQPLYFDASHFTVEAMSLLEGLLQRDPDKRLGSGPTDYLEITSHPYFKEINWEDLYNKKVEPSFKPHLQNATDARYFDPEFTSQTPRDSITDTKLSKTYQRAFDGFSYVAPSLEAALAAKRKSIRASRSQRGMGQRRDTFE